MTVCISCEEQRNGGPVFVPEKEHNFSFSALFSSFSYSVENCNQRRKKRERKKKNKGEKKEGEKKNNRKKSLGHCTGK